MADYTFLEKRGSRIRFVVEGEGPLLFLVGAPVGIHGFAPLSKQLGRWFSVVRHDPRGIGGSTWPTGDSVTPAMLADDLLALIEHLAGESAYIFGQSGGAVTGLELLTRAPGMIKKLVAHEAPVFGMLPDASDILSKADAAFELAQADPDAGMQAFADAVEIMHETFELSPRPQPLVLPPAPADEREKNRFFLSKMAPATVHYQPMIGKIDVSRLELAAGSASIGQPARRTTEALAAACGIPVWDAPGNHLGIVLKPAEFADWLQDRLSR